MWMCGKSSRDKGVKDRYERVADKLFSWSSSCCSFLTCSCDEVIRALRSDSSSCYSTSTPASSFHILILRNSTAVRASDFSSSWIGLCSVLRPRQHSIGYMGDGFYRSKDPTNSIKVLKEQIVHRKNQTHNKQT